MVIIIRDAEQIFLERAGNRIHVVLKNGTERIN